MPPTAISDIRAKVTNRSSSVQRPSIGLPAMAPGEDDADRPERQDDRHERPAQQPDADERPAEDDERGRRETQPLGHLQAGPDEEAGRRCRDATDGAVD